ncbi:MAG TPA: DUF6259 domain-containing protein [Candidatus Hydrogenedens sp.]|nr:DUF6259 domain-containing protein [Candidatus Hydrogenedens sp.]
MVAKRFMSVLAIFLCYGTIQFHGVYADMNNEITTEYYRLVLNPTTGDIESLQSEGQELIFPPSQSRGLFTIRLRDDNGTATDLSSLKCSSIQLSREETDQEIKLRIEYAQLEGKPISATVFVQCPKHSRFTYWTINIKNETGLWLEHIDFPVVVVPDNLPNSGGDARLFWPGGEGVVVEDSNLREKSWLRWQPIEHPTMGWNGVYPGPAQMQFMAYYTPRAGLYFSAHDPQGTPKGVEFHKHPLGGIYLDFRLYPGPVCEPDYTLPYPMVLGVFKGDWHDSAEIYRNWWETSTMYKPPKLEDNPVIPDWYYKSPIIVMYPVRGQRDLGVEMTPNPEYYPYTNALPILQKLASDLESSIMALLMHWESSAPWAPPYVWPPYGDFEDFCRFRDALHKSGDLIGLYASGSAYTIKSNTDPTYNMTKEFQEKRVIQYVTYAPDGKPAENGVCAGPNAQRIGYDLCPATEWVKQVVVNEITKIISHNIDYLQYFDQNLGGNCYRCYARHHGHPPGPGLWQTESMKDLYRRIWEQIHQHGSKMLIGCEANSAEPFIPYLLFNDSRSYLNFAIGIPVPAYGYIFHEYLNNFMGNQNGTSHFVDEEKSPYNLHQRVAISFIQGDMLSINLRQGGKIAWEWSSAPWDKGPNHEQILTLIRNLNKWRTGKGNKYLFFGKMLKPFEYGGDKDVPLITPRRGDIIHFRSILASRWMYKDQTAMFLVNYLPEPQTASINLPDAYHTNCSLHLTPSQDSEANPLPENQNKIEIPPLSAIMLEWNK